MAVPGSPLDPRAHGCNQLIRDGATLVQNADDVVEAIHLPASIVRAASIPYEPIEQVNGDDALGVVEELLGPSPVPVDEIIGLSGRRAVRCKWRSSSSTSPGASTGTLAAR
jgi:DNA processing protein